MDKLNNRFRLKYWTSNTEDHFYFSMTGLYHWNDIIKVIKQVIPKKYNFRLKYNPHKYVEEIDTSDDCLTLNSLKEKLISIWYTIPIEEELEKEYPIEDTQIDYMDLPESTEDIFGYDGLEVYEEYPQDYYDQYPPANKSQITIKNKEISFVFNNKYYTGILINTYNIPDINNIGDRGTYFHIFSSDNIIYEVSEKWQYWYDDIDFSPIENVKILITLK